MEYRGCLDYLEKLGNEYLTMKLGLEKVRVLLAELNHPEREFHSILVAGTNGKGSVAHFLASLLGATDPNCGLYTSPHVVCLRERIQIGESMICKQAFSRAFSRVVRGVRSCGFRYHPTYFELVTVTAFVAFYHAASRMAVLEVGLGGRLDTTNVVEPEISVITPIALDHQHVLGNTLPEIAGEKAGIMRAGKPVVVAPQHPEARYALRAAADRVGALWVELEPGEIETSPLQGGRYHVSYRGTSADLKLLGAHQAENAALAILAAHTLQSRGYQLAAQSWPRRLEAVGPRGVLHPLDEDPLTLVDGGHNPHALGSLADFVRNHTTPPRTLILGMMRDKDAGSSLQQLTGLFDQIFFVPIQSPRAADPQRLLEIHSAGRVFDDPIQALQVAREQSRFVLVAGSFYLAGEILSRWSQARATAG